MPVRSWARSCALLVTVVSVLLTAPAGAAAGTISGTAFQDANRDGARQADEAGLADHAIYLFDATGRNVAHTATDAAGHYAFSGLADGDYRVAYDTADWFALRDAWVPTTTGSIRPSVSLQLAGSATADFGWRAIVRSTDPSAPISRYTGPSGLRVASYDDVVTAREVHDAIATAEIGAEAPSTEIRFDLGPGSQTQSSAASSDGTYTSFSAISYVAYADWLDDGDQTLTHEYGHAWSLYRAYLVQQDPSLAAYLKARGLDGDARVGSSYAWSPREMIAEDYRQLFGSPTAAAAPLINREIPPAADVPGLKDFLLTTFSQAPASPSPTPTPTPAAPLSLTGLAMNPGTVVSTGTASVQLSAPATLTVSVRTTKGALVRTLIAAAPEQAGTASAVWDRKDSSGRTVKRGKYVLRADATDAGGRTVTQNAGFSTS